MLLVVAALTFADACQSDATTQQAFVSAAYSDDAALDRALDARRADVVSQGVVECAALVVAGLAGVMTMWPSRRR